MRVVTIIDSLLAGGAERVAVELACALDREQFDPHVLVTRGDGPLRKLLDQAELPYTILDRRSTLEIAAWRKARALVAQADVIHSHKFGSNVWGALLSRATGVPLIAHEHNFSETVSRSRALLNRHWVGRRATRVICVSESVAEAQRQSGVSSERIEVVPNAVRTGIAWPRAAARQELGIPAEEFTIGITARLRAEKAHEVLLDAAALMRAEGRDIRVCVLGDGPRKQELQDHAAKLGIEAHIIWAGEHDNAARFASAFDVSVISSDWEGLPLAALESMASGIPIVATHVGGLPKLLADGAGLTVPRRDARALANAISSLVENPELRRSMGAKSFERIQQSYSFAAFVEYFENLYCPTASVSQDFSRMEDVA